MQKAKAKQTMQCTHTSSVVLLLSTNATRQDRTSSAHNQGEQADRKCRLQTSMSSKSKKPHRGRMKTKQERRQMKKGLVMGTLTSKGGSFGPVMVQIIAVSRSKPSEVMLLPKSKVADVMPACIRRSHNTV